ncbi:MAG: GNAT family N-acetyltransferase [Bacteriovoracaceae bacterium]|nr:GNAT family N-acetyltransferase [Bacteriovoracaceae bacterium]
MSKLIIRSFTLQDESEVPKVLKSIWKDDQDMIESHSIHMDWKEAELTRVTLTAETDNRVVGFGTVFETDFHPKSLFLVINISPEYQRRGIGTIVFSKLIEYQKEKRFLVKTRINNEASVSFLKKRNFNLITKTALGSIDSESKEIELWLDKTQEISSGIDIEFCDVENNLSLRKEMAYFLATSYENDHFWDRPAVLDEQFYLNLFMGKNIIPNTTIRIVADGEMLAASTLLKIEEGEAYWTWYGLSSKVSSPDLKEMYLQALLRKSLLICRDKNLLLKYEADSINEYPYNILKQIPSRDFSDTFSLWVNS